MFSPGAIKLGFFFRKLSDGLFLKECSAISKMYPNIEFNSMIIDNCCMQVKPCNYFSIGVNKVIQSLNEEGHVTIHGCAGLDPSINFIVNSYILHISDGV